ncbi:hypothetical protein ALCH109712_17050 [Alkalicoccus chagannorensis]
MSTAFQFFVELMEIDIAEQWRQVTTLRRAAVRGRCMVADPDSCLQEPSDQIQDLSVRDELLDQVHQFIVMNGIKVLFQVDIHDVAVSGFMVGNRLSDGSVGIFLWPETVALFGEVWIDFWCNDLHQRLLDDPISNRRDSQCSFFSIPFWDERPFDRVRFVRTVR